MDENDAEIQGSVERALRFWDGEPFERLLPRERAIEAIRAGAAAPGAAERAAARFRERFDEALERLRRSDVSAVTVLGREAVEAIVRATGEVEPSEAAIRSLFIDPAAEALLASLLYDGIIEFLRKMNSLGDMVPGVALAKKLGSGLLGGLAGALGGGAGGAFEKAAEAQVKSFLQGFIKVALERGVRFVTSPANRAVFADMRRRLARRALERPAREALASLGDERARGVRDGIASWLEARVRDLAKSEGPGSAAAVVGWIYERAGKETPAALADRFGIARPDPRTMAKLLTPAVAAFLARERPGPSA